MVPDKFNMVDMEGIDLIAVQGETIPGLYNKLVESIAQCRYQCIYNWAFNGILIPPTYVEMEEEADGVWINEGVMVDEEDVVHIASIEPEPPVPILPVIESLSATENGIYQVSQGVDGFNPVTVNVPSYAPVIEPITITENGTYTVSSGKDGFNPVVVNVPASVSKYLLQTPIHYDFVGGYVSSGTWNVNDTAARTDIYQVYSGKHYIIHLGSTVGNRFRCAFFTTDPALAVSNLQGTSIYSVDNPQQYGCAGIVMFSPSADGFVAIGKTNQSVDGLKSYLIDFEESA